MNRKEFLEKLELYLKESSFLDDFKFRDKDSSFIRKHKDPKGWDEIGLKNWESFGDDGEQLSVEVGYRKRLDKYHSWYDEFNFKRPADRRICATVGFANSMIPTDKPWMYHLPFESLNTEAKIAKFRTDLVENAHYVYENFDTEEKIYKGLVYPILENDISKLGVGAGADWVFIYLSLAWVNDQDNYEKVKDIILKQVDFLHTVQKNPNIAQYYDKMNSILEKLESGILWAQNS